MAQGCKRDGRDRDSKIIFFGTGRDWDFRDRQKRDRRVYIPGMARVPNQSMDLAGSAGVNILGHDTVLTNRCVGGISFWYLECLFFGPVNILCCLFEVYCVYKSL